MSNEASTERSNQSPSRRVLWELPERAVTFLCGVGTHAGVRRALESAGYSAAHHAEGWRLLAAVGAYGTGGITPDDDAPAREAEARIVDWVQTHFARLKKGLGRLHPQARLFDGMDSPTAREAVLALATLLERIERLPPEDSAVLDTLAERGVGASQRQRLEDWVRRVQVAPVQLDQGETREVRTAELLALYEWHSDWALTARCIIKRRDYLMTLGLARRTRRNAQAVGAPGGRGSDTLVSE